MLVHSFLFLWSIRCRNMPPFLPFLLLMDTWVFASYQLIASQLQTHNVYPQAEMAHQEDPSPTGLRSHSLWRRHGVTHWIGKEAALLLYQWDLLASALPPIKTWTEICPPERSEAIHSWCRKHSATSASKGPGKDSHCRSRCWRRHLHGRSWSRKSLHTPGPEDWRCHSHFRSWS